ncbi:hypothetical protein CK936_22655 [Streptomyces albireticuli]|uniref:Uncharacterized protein n=1 Tax=Streptomyces albireticuli TaxID=1940 RepID=A0A2A2D5Y2_9ACTN|nr:hypothetical protein CK936_22655 [Streptomyces albireticuli]
MPHKIDTHPLGEITVTARCLDAGCGWSLIATADLKAADTAMMTHTGLHGHPTFTRTYEDVALVRRLELNEGQPDMPPLPSAEEHARATA